MAENSGSGVEDDLDAFMDELEVAAGGELGDSTSLLDGDPELQDRMTGLSAFVAEFVPLDRRRFSGEQPLTPAEQERWSELREILEYHFGSANPPLGGTRRRSLRVPTELKVRTSNIGEAVCKLRDLSLDGAFCESSEVPEVGSSLTLEIDPGDGAAPMRIEAVVRWSRELPNMNGPAGIGVEFTGLEDDDVAALARAVEAQLFAVGRRSN